MIDLTSRDMRVYNVRENDLMPRMMFDTIHASRCQSDALQDLGHQTMSRVSIDHINMNQIAPVRHGAFSKLDAATIQEVYCEMFTL